MIEEVRVYDSRGKLKKVISAKKLTDKYWEDYEKSKGLTSNARLKKAQEKCKRSLIFDGWNS